MRKYNNSIHTCVWLSPNHHIIDEKTKNVISKMPGSSNTAVSSKNSTTFMLWKWNRSILYTRDYFQLPNQYLRNFDLVTLRQIRKIKNICLKSTQMNLINERLLHFNLLHCIILPFMATEKYTALKQLRVKPLKILEMDCTILKQFIW